MFTHHKDENTTNKSNTTNTYDDLIEETISLKPTDFDCLREETPSNIGPYEIPTKQDMGLFTWNLLADMFHSYSREAVYLLKDIREATKATAGIENKCEGDKLAYRECVRHVSRQCQQITKNLVNAMTNKKEQISIKIEANVCNISKMTSYAIEILTSIAQERVYLEFALPAFLRLLSACSLNCIQSAPALKYKNKPMRHMTDQDLVIKHFLTHKNYLELIMDSRHKTKANTN